MSGYPEELREQVDAYLASLSFDEHPATAGLQEAMRYSLLAGGKRIRPVLCLATGRALGGRARRSAADRSRDRADPHLLADPRRSAGDGRRRAASRATDLARRHGEDVAILAGDALFAEAIRLIAERQRGEPARVLAAIREIAGATGVDGMVGGQYVDVTGGGADAVLAARAARAEDRPADRRQRRSGAGPRRARRGRRRVPTGASPSELGVLFQIVDDILDVTGSDEELGKPSGSDERHGKVTYV